MYKIDEILREVEEFMMDSVEETDKMKQDCQRVLDMYQNENIEAACKQVCDWVEVLRDKKIQFLEFPSWFRKIIYNLVYRHLNQKDGHKYNQTDLLEQMNLPKDVFKPRYWNMYSPDMKIRQSQYECISLPFNYAEVECNEIHRALIHYMICQADILTDTIVDLFGKMGLVPALCANGYSYRKAFATGDKYKELVLFQRALKKPVKLYKRIKDMQYYLSRRSYKEQIKVIPEFLERSQLHTMTLIKSVTVEQVESYSLEMQDEGIYSWAADYFYRLCFTPEYWLDCKRIVDNGVVTTWTDTSKVSHKQIERFISMTREEFLKFAELYVKKVKLVNNGAKNCIYDIREESLYYALNKYIGVRDLLYIDPPKYIREEKRFYFTTQDQLVLLDMLMRHEGNWILVWKMYVEKPEGATYAKDKKYEKLYNSNDFLGEEEFGKKNTKEDLH